MKAQQSTIFSNLFSILFYDPSKCCAFTPLVLREYFPCLFQCNNKTAIRSLSRQRAMLHNGSGLQNVKTCSGEEVYASLCLFFSSHCPECWWKSNSKAARFLDTAGQGQSTAQLGLLRALRQEGTPPMPRGQTTPRCCPKGHKMSGEARAQMEDCLCQCVCRRHPWICQEQGMHTSQWGWGGRSVSCANAEATFTLEKGKNAWMLEVTVGFIMSS